MMSKNLAAISNPKILGGLSKNSSNELMLAILRAVDSLQAQKSTGHNQSHLSFISKLFLLLRLLGKMCLKFSSRLELLVRITRSQNAFTSIGKRW
jgi:hypothetical protein